jgi:hypothetical protein
MRVLRREDYETLAKEAVAKMVGERIPLAKSLVKISDDNGLNPDQIKALVQVANTLAHLDLFDRKNDGDKIVNFDPADPDEVVKSVVSDGGCSACGGGSSNVTDQIKDFFGDLGSNPTPPPAPAALADVGTPVSMGSGSDDLNPRRTQIMIIKIRKVAEELKHRKLAADIQYREEFDKLASEFSKLYGPKFEEFEKDAIDIHGAAAMPMLTELRQAMRLPEIKLAVFTKTARLVDTSTQEMRSFSRMKSFADEARACTDSLTYLEKEIGSFL